ncbi:apoptosis facilitator Bcl-2-like protein 14 isoform X1 [Anguilla anguilla]|uniref:apoptosis facilitator Bcl-2-like protein 14 isoform X1 n=1 Tax=Anguilla anguilla TaxID=7936 RepID=UPI0015AD99AC|nr:apoptosis facilitator Bcl-2-like protein 14 isoform X1 [Anguilla anguilla]
MEAAGANGALPGAGEDSLEFRLIMAYVQKRKPLRRIAPATAKAHEAPRPPRDSGRRTKKKQKLGKLRMFFPCIRSQEEEAEQRSQPSEPDGGGRRFRAAGPDRTCSAGTVVAVTEKLTRIVDSVPLEFEDIETDGPDDVVQTIVELLRESGDRLNEEMKTNKSLAELFRKGFTYSLFERVTGLFLQKVDPSHSVPSSVPEQAQVALAFEVTSRLTAVDCHPMNVVMGFGAKYLQENYSSWVKQHGGWENAFDAEDDEEVQ